MESVGPIGLGALLDVHHNSKGDDNMRFLNLIIEIVFVAPWLFPPYVLTRSIIKGDVIL